jgi:DNA repair protein RadC
MEKKLNKLLAAEVTLVYKTKIKASDRIQINGASDAYNFLIQTWDKNKLELQEQFKVILMNCRNHVLGIYELSTGGVTGTVADPKLIFMAALKANACTVIVAHNHPSGDPYPSMADKDLTKKITQAGELLDITVHDHIIVTKCSYYSFTHKQLTIQ